MDWDDNPNKSKEKYKYKCCQNETYHCSLPVLPGSVYCQQHVLHETRKNPYKRCEYLYGNRKRCTTAVHKGEKGNKKRKLMCELHKQENIVPPKKRVNSEEELWQQLSKQLKIKSDDSSEVFKSYEHVINLENANEPLDLSDFQKKEREEESLHLPRYRKMGEDWSDSDTMGDDSDEDCLKHSGIYTEPELLRINISYMKKLGTLYGKEIEQLKQKMRKLNEKYHARKSASSVSSNKSKKKSKSKKKFRSVNNAKEAKYKSYNKFNRSMTRVRARKTRPKPTTDQTIERCCFIDHIVPCRNETFDKGRYCFKHICEDKTQFLFKPCGYLMGSVFCKEPILKTESACVYHIELNDNTKNNSPTTFEYEIEQNLSSDADDESDEPVPELKHENTYMSGRTRSELYNLLEEIEANL